ncbi:hypothetical protein trd_A0794 (plasmid) [Thermomicrobium roseum DSM 5159]|uniref:Uncharacterized protein n=1 Tax=Thermomicrobium roseum (strain ATCC 27502 / DSM 5159 / P-2) TaxID=309801 RepID=B9L4T0_THERP|nr:hypothetical protein trd_A0794 [Thermomicrobium roseum DSM 5159]
MPDQRHPYPHLLDPGRTVRRQAYLMYPLRLFSPCAMLRIGCCDLFGSRSFQK